MKLVDFDLIHKIKQHINKTHKQKELLSERKKWLRVTAALDVLEDTSWAIEYYVDKEYPDDIRGKYLYTYGMLQSLYVQQDAINSINNALFGSDIEYKKYPEAGKVREIRNDVVGHPTYRDERKFIHLAQCSMTKNGFYYIKNDSKTGKSETITVNVLKAIEDVARAINDILRKSVVNLDNEYKEYINQHKDRKMKQIFSNLIYAKSKVLNNEYMKDSEYIATKEMVKRVEEELILRYGSVEALDCYKYIIDEIYEIYDLVDNAVLKTSEEYQDKFEKYLLQLLFVKLEELELYCEEIDDEFESKDKVN